MVDVQPGLAVIVHEVHFVALVRWRNLDERHGVSLSLFRAVELAEIYHCP